jgi:hypothetical protein
VNPGLIIFLWDSPNITKNNKECSSWTDDFLVGTLQNFKILSLFYDFDIFSSIKTKQYVVYIVVIQNNF